MWFISKAVKGHEFLYSKRFTIKCASEKQAWAVAEFMNEHNDSAIGEFKLKDNETWHAYEDGIIEPIYKLHIRKGKLSLSYND